MTHKIRHEVEHALKTIYFSRRHSRQLCTQSQLYPANKLEMSWGQTEQNEKLGNHNERI